MTLFEGALKNITNRHKCDNIFPDFFFLSFLGIYFSKKNCEKIFYFQKAMSAFDDFSPKKID